VLGANFDNVFAGVAPDAGSTNGNVHAPLAGLGAGVLGFVETPVGDGWRIRYNADLLWDDGPGAPEPGAIDLQGVATRFVGNTLGLGSSRVPGATMGPSLIGDGTALRSIEADDVAGVQAIYGVAAATKPGIDAVSGSCVAGDPLVIDGAAFAPFGNEVWFTDAETLGEPLVVEGVASTAGGTRIELPLPAGADDGEVLVRVPGQTGASLSNAFPLNVVDGGFGFVGPGLACAAGTPRLAGDGSLSTAPGSGPALIDVSGAAPFAPVTLFVGPASRPTPLKGGVLYPVPILAQVPLGPTDAQGRRSLTATIPPAPAGTFVVLQAWIADATGPQGVTATNGLSLTLE